MKKSLLSLAILVSCVSAQASDIKLSGFGSLMLTENPFESKYMEYRKGTGLDGSKFGINAFSKLNDNLSISAQLLNKTQAGGRETFFRWAFLDYKVSDNGSMRIGKMPVTTRSASDINFINSWSNEPGEYFQQDPFRSIEGMEYRYSKSFGSGEAVDFNVTYGRSDADIDFSHIAPGVIGRAEAHNLIVADLAYRNDTSELRFLTATGKAILSVSEDVLLMVALAPEGTADAIGLAEAGQGGTISSYSISFEHAATDTVSVKGAISLANSGHISVKDQYGYYITTTKYFENWQLHYTYASQVEKFSGDWVDSQKSHKVGVTVGLNDNSNIRFEATRIDSKLPVNDNFLTQGIVDDGVMTSVAYSFIF